MPAAIRPLFRQAQRYVTRYFGQRQDNPEHGSLSISGERYVLVRAASLSVEFFDLVTSLYQDKGPEAARGVASNLLFDLAHAIGKADARAFHRRMGVREPIEKLSIGPIHFSFCGWAFVDISPESNPVPTSDFLLLYEHPYSFESDAWVKHGRRSAVPVCVMNAGYSSGWCAESFGLALVAVEVECLAAGGKRCRFVMAPPARIDQHLARLTRRRRRPAPFSSPRGASAPAAVPEFFQRKRMEEELRRAQQLLEERVEERTSELRAANARLREEIAERQHAERAREEFLSVAAHELRTPITSLRGFSQVLLRGLERGRPMQPRRLRQALQAVDEQSAKLTLLVGQLLDVSRLQAGRLVLERRVADVVQVVESALAAARVRTRDHALLRRGGRAALAPIDPLRLEQVVANLLDNAIRFSPAGAHVEVAVETGERVVTIAVSDRGPGIPKNQRERVFERFYQSRTHRRLGGMGLGLYISRQIVELHGGSIRIEARRGGGTRVVASLPVAAA